MHAMADALMTYETIDKYQLDDLLERKTPVREPQGWGDDTALPEDRTQGVTADKDNAIPPTPIGGLPAEQQ